jgi:hypothetical protein
LCAHQAEVKREGTTKTVKGTVTIGSADYVLALSALAQAAVVKVESVQVMVKAKFSKAILK